MPVYLKSVDDFSKLDGFGSVLIVPCRFCPAASMAVSTNRPYFEFLRRFLKTAPYEEYIEAVRSGLEKKGIRADVFRSRWLHQFVVCMWTRRRRKKLSGRARGYDAVVVLGCEAALDTVCDSVESSSCKVFQGMRTEGIMGIRPRFEPPGSIHLDLNTVTPLVYRGTGETPWAGL